VVFAGHAEYWSQAMRDWLNEHVLRLGDVGLALLGANTGYWPVRISPDGRTVTCYKEAITKPGYSGPTMTANGLRVVLRFRDPPSGTKGSGQPEQQLFGVQYGSLVPDDHEYMLGANVPPQLLRGTGLTPGASLGTIAGGETDFVAPDAPVPAGQTTIAAASFVDLYGSPGGAAAVFRPLPSGKAVFAAGSFRWSWGLDTAFAMAHGVPPSFQQLTRNILDRVSGH
jgi:hypothetical protein